MFQLVALMGAAAHLGMQAKALLVDTAHKGQWRLSCRDGLQAQHFLPRPRPRRNVEPAFSETRAEETRTIGGLLTLTKPYIPTSNMRNLMEERRIGTIQSRVF
jgi:hypothetical protein